MTTEKSRPLALRFGHCEVRSVERQVLVAGQAAPIGSRAFDVLMALIERPGRAVSRTELLDAAWPGLVVEENNLSVQIAALRKALGPQVITTIPGLGYRFSAALGSDALSPRDEGPSADRTAPPRAGNVPSFLQELIGRDTDVRAVAALLGEHRLVTITGTGGIGKTRLAYAVASCWPTRPPDGVWLVELAPVADPALLPAAVAQTLGLRLPGLKTPMEEAVEALIDAELVLVLDNCEHVVEEASRLAQALLDHARGVKVLATSQELLKLPGEHVHRLQPLSVPPPDASAVDEHGAVKLLVARVRALQPRFALEAGSADDVVEICRRLDGLPLAIELAAARVPLLGLAGVRARLDERFRILTGGSRASLRRHRTLRETLAWSHSLLNAGERAAFRRAGVFAGSFGLPQAEYVLGRVDDDPWTVLEWLSGLVDKSLVNVDDTDPPRYRLLESARAYALEMLQEAGETPATQRRHAEAMRVLFDESVALQWRLPSQQRLRRFLPDLDNGRSALEWALHADPAMHIALATSMAWLFSAAGHGPEGLRNAQRALSQLGDTTPALAEARLQHELCGLNHGSPGAESLAQRAVDLLRDTDDLASLYSALGRLAIAAALSDDGDRGELAIREMASILDPAWPALSRWELLNARDYVANAMHRMDEAEALAAEELALARAHNDTAKTLFALLAAEQCAATRENYQEAVVRGREIVQLAQRERYVEKMNYYISNLATSLAMCGEVDEALSLARRSAALDARSDTLWQTLDMMAMLALRRGRVAEAARILGRADAANKCRQPVEANVRQAVVKALSAVLTPDQLADLLADGARLNDDQATALALDDRDGFTSAS